MLYFDRIDVSEGINVSKTGVSRGCGICHCWHFLNKDSKFQPNVCKKCHNLLMMSMNLGDITILNIKGSDYLCIIFGISKYEAMKNTDFTKKSETL